MIKIVAVYLVFLFSTVYKKIAKKNALSENKIIEKNKKKKINPTSNYPKFDIQLHEFQKSFFL